MGLGFRSWRCLAVLSLLCALTVRQSYADDIVHMVYGGHNETIGPYWVAVERGIYQRHGIDARLLQVRNAQISLAALVSGEVPIFPAIGCQCSQWRVCGREARLWGVSDKGNFP